MRLRLRRLKRNKGMFQRFQHRGWHYAILLIAGATFFLVNLGKASLWDVDEGRNATCAYEMMVSGIYVVPTLNSELRVDKPVLLYWLQILAYEVLGVNETAARLPSALAALATLLVCYELGRSLFGKTTGLLAGLILAGTPLMIASARFANPDALLHLFLVLTMFCFWQSQRGGAWWSAAMGASCGLAVLAKGPIGLVVPLAIAGCYCLWIRNAGMLSRRRLNLAVLTFLLVALPWYVLVAIETKGEFVEGFLMIHNVHRFLATANLHSASYGFYPVVLILGTLPWSIFAVPAVWYAFAPDKQTSRQGDKETRRQGDEETGECPSSSPCHLVTLSPCHPVTLSPCLSHSAVPRFLFCWIGVIVLFFSLAATKLPNYILPVAVPCVLLVASYLVRWCRGEIRPPAWLIHVGLGALVLIGVGIVAGTLIGSGVWRLRGVKDTFPGLERGAVLALGPVVGALVCWWLWRRGRQAALVCTFTLAGLAFLAPVALWANAFWDDYKAPRALVAESNMRDTERNIVIATWKLEHLPSLNFYSRRDIVRCESPEQILDYLNWDSAHWNIDVYVILATEDWEALKYQVTAPYRELAHHYDMFHRVDLVVVSNR